MDEWKSSNAKIKTRMSSIGLAVGLILSGTADSFAEDKTFSTTKSGNYGISGDYYTSSSGAAIYASGKDIFINDDGPVMVEANGDYLYGIHLRYGAQLTLDDPGSAITTFGNHAEGIRLEMDGTNVKLDGVTVTTSGDSADGIAIYYSGTHTIEVDNVSITTFGSNSSAIDPANADVTLISQNGPLTIETFGSGSKGISAMASGPSLPDRKLQLTGSTITTHGESAFGIGLRGYSDVMLDNVSVTTEGDNSYAVGFQDSIATVDGGVYKTSGSYSDAIDIMEYNAVNLSNLRIETYGSHSNGVEIARGSSANLEHVTILTDSDLAYGVSVINSAGKDTLVTATDINITTQGERAYGIYLQNGSDIEDLTIDTFGENSDGAFISLSGSGTVPLEQVVEVNDGVIHTYGAGSAGINVMTARGAAFTDMSVTSEQSSGIRMNGNTAIAVTNSQVIGKDAGYYLTDHSSYNSAVMNSLVVDGGSVAASADGSAFYIENTGTKGVDTDITLTNRVRVVDTPSILTVSENDTIDNITFTAADSLLKGAFHAGGDNVDVKLDSGTVWVATGDSHIGHLTNDGRIAVNSAHATLDVGELTLTSQSQLDAILDPESTQVQITGTDVTLNGNLNVVGIGNIGDSLAQGAHTYTLIDADNAINGDFDSFTVAGIDAKQVDFITVNGTIDAIDNTKYDLAASLSWYSGETLSATPAHGVFTLNNADGSFTVGTALVDVAPDVASGWDGRTLTKQGAGELVLSANNTYSGDTYVNDGTLWLTNTGIIGQAGSTQNVNVASGAAFGGNGVVNGNLINSGNVAISKGGETGNTLTVNGNYVGNNGSIIFNTQLGDDNSPTDRLVISGDTAGNTKVYVNNVGGLGAQTTNGIEVIDVGGISSGDFTQANQVQVDLYEYRLYKDSASGNWYLRSLGSSPIPDGRDNAVQYRADIGAYLGNQWLACSLQMQTLYDREGSQFKSANGSVWARFKAGKSESTAVDGNVNIDSNYSQFQIGGDIAAWNNGVQSLAVGLMGSYVNANTDSEGNGGADGSRFKADGRVDGYNIGLYATWFADAGTHQGAYVDSWYQYGFYNNTVDNGDVGSTSYDSSASAASLESGYRYDVKFSTGNTLGLTPQAQVVWQRYSADSVDSNSTRVGGQNGNAWMTRLGLRVDGKLHKNDSVIQPFAEANWLHTTDYATVSFNGAGVAQDMPTDRVELKSGVQVNVNERLSVYAQAAGQKGKNDYSDVNFSLNLRYQW